MACDSAVTARREILQTSNLIMGFFTDLERNVLESPANLWGLLGISQQCLVIASWGAPAVAEAGASGAGSISLGGGREGRGGGARSKDLRSTVSPTAPAEAAASLEQAAQQAR